MKTVLIIEDDKLLGKALQDTFEESGYESLWAKDGEEGVLMIKDKNPDIIYLDIMMPKKDGYTVLRELKADETYKNIPVVMLSNLGQQDEISRAMDMGAVDYVVKANIDLDALIELTRSKIG